MANLIGVIIFIIFLIEFQKNIGIIIKVKLELSYSLYC